MKTLKEILKQKVAANKFKLGERAEDFDSAIREFLKELDKQLNGLSGRTLSLLSTAKLRAVQAKDKTRVKQAEAARKAIKKAVDDIFDATERLATKDDGTRKKV